LILARADSFEQVIAGQVISSVLYIGQPILVAVSSEILPRKLRPAAQGGLNAAGAAGSIVGLLAGTSLTNASLYGWRNYWYIVTALMGISGIIIAFLYKPQPLSLQKALTTRDKLGRLDWSGYVLLGIGLVLFCMGLSWGDSPYAWKSAHVLAPLIIGGTVLIVLVLHQTSLKKHGLIDHDLFKRDRNFALAIGCFFVDGMIFWAYNSYFPVEMSVLYVETPIVQGVRLCVAFFSAIFAVCWIPLLTRLTNSIREPVVISFVSYVIFFGKVTPKRSSHADNFQF
jgi:hypothetical protein